MAELLKQAPLLADAGLGEWAELLKQAPLVAMVLFLGFAVVHLFRSRDKLQAKYAEDLVRATASLQELTSQHLTQSFTDSASWQEQINAIGGKIDHCEQTMVAPLAKMVKQIDALQTKVNDLWEWHNKEDEDGVKLWYVKRSHGETLKTLVTEIEALRAVVEKLRSG